MTLFDAGTLGALTPAYATIAMIEGDDPDIRDDIYALGCVAYEVFTGRHPYKKRSALKARTAGMELEPVNGLNRRQWKSIQKALAFEREGQPESVDDFMDGQTTIQGGLKAFVDAVKAGEYPREEHTYA